MTWSLRSKVHSLKMYFSFMSVIPFALFLMSLTANSSGEVIMIRSPQKTDDKSMKMKLTCVTEDNDGALFWMGNLQNIHSADDCALTWDLENVRECHYDPSTNANVTSIKWSTKHMAMNWGVYSSTKYPLEPEFKNQLPGKGYYQLEGWLRYHQDSGSLVFFRQDYAQRILRIRECEQPKVPTVDRIDCTISSFNPTNLTFANAYKWHAYTLTWNSTGISVNHHSHVSTTTEQLEVPQPQIAVNLEDRNATAFYGYSYLNTSKENSHLQFRVSSSGEHICLSLTVSLCLECQLDVSIVTNDTVTPNEFVPIGTIFAKVRPERGHFPNWQFEVLKATSKSYDRSDTIIKVTTTKNKTCFLCYWSLYSIRTCKLPIPSIQKSRRISAITDGQVELSCQKISNHKIIEVSSTTSISNNPSSSLKKCLREDRPICDFDCGASCEGTSICFSTSDSTRCTCAPGFKGKNCDTECPRGRFGYNCFGKCRGCRNERCTSTNGMCRAGCKNDSYLPPYCERTLEKPCIDYSLPVKIRYCKDLLPHELKDIRFEIQEQGKSDEWVSISGNRVSNDILEWSEEMIKNLNPYRKHNVRAVLNETKGMPSFFDVNRLPIRRPEYLIASTLESNIVKLEWRYSHIHWQKVKWFYLKIELLKSKQGKNLSLQDPVWKLYPVEENQIEYYGTVLLETAADYNISLLLSTDNMTKGLISGTAMHYTLPQSIHFAQEEDLQVNRNATSIIFDRPSTVTEINNAIIRILLYGSLACPMKIAIPSAAKMEWEASTYESACTIPQILTITNISDCKLLSNEAYVVKVVVSYPVKNESTLIVIDIEKLPECSLVWIIVFPVLLCFFLGAYILHRYRNHDQQPHWPLYELKTLDCDSGGHPEKLVAFENSVRKDAEDGLLEHQFTLLPKGLVRPCEYGRLPENKYKNRYGNMIAYDETRVMLVKNPGDPYSDYINANYIQGYLKKNAYIASQAPLPETVVDFWRMVWQEEVRVICMLVDLIEGRRVMCEKYWPEVGRKVQYGELVISNLAEHEFANYTCRTFVVRTRSGMEQRQVDHLQYRGWTDQEIPMHSHSLIEYLKKLQSIAPGPGPIVVHCCAGVGRTGCIILCDICLHRIIVEGTVNVRMEAESMFNARANMLQNYLQYTLAHLAPIQFRRTLPTTVPCCDLSPEKIEQLKNDLPVHMGWLKSSAWMHEALRPLEPLVPRHPENVSKNRFPKLMPVGPYLVKLPRYPAYDTTSDYISAVSVDGVRMKKQYLASQLPMPSTLTDFWRLIVEENVELIVILQDPDPEDPTCCAVIPRENTLIPYPYMKVETKETLESTKYFTTKMLLLTDTSEVPTRTRNITTITCNDGRLDRVTSPPPPEALIKLWLASENIKRTSAPTLILCYDGVTACGLYMAMSFVLEGMSLEQECDVISAVQAVRRSRSEFVQFPWEFHYLYDAVMEYMESFKIYANFS